MGGRRLGFYPDQQKPYVKQTCVESQRSKETARTSGLNGILGDKFTKRYDISAMAENAGHEYGRASPPKRDRHEARRVSPQRTSAIGLFDFFFTCIANSRGRPRDDRA